MGSRLLFLLGGSDGDILDRTAEPFVAAAGEECAAIALLLIGGEGVEAHVERYRAPWAARGVKRVEVIAPREDGELDPVAARKQLRQATGIFVGGGRTAIYHRLYATEPIRSLIRKRHWQGVPVAGLSAGALICPEVCLLRPTPRDPDQPFRIVEGLGLVGDLIVEVHFTETPGTLPSLLEGMARTRTTRGLGIGSAGCVVLEDGRPMRGLGHDAYEVMMKDFDTRECVVSQLRLPP